MNRRRFLGHAAAATGLGALGCAAFTPARAEACRAFARGAQLFTLRGLLQQDARAALAALRAAGIDEVELYGLDGRADMRVAGHALSDLARMIADSGLRVPCAHVDGALTNVGPIADAAQKLGIRQLFVGMPAQFADTTDGRFRFVRPTGTVELDALAATLSRVGREYAAHGIAFGYHNHHVEFTRLGDVVAYDYLMAATDPDAVGIELDIGWVALAGFDPVAYLARYAGRVRACHMKDFDPAIRAETDQQRLVEPGAGTIDFAAVMTAMQAAGVEHGFIEIDVSSDPLAAIGRGHEHLGGLC